MSRTNRFGMSRIQEQEMFRRKTLTFTPTNNKITIVACDEDKHNEYDSKQIVLTISHQRAIKLANEILSFYDRKHQEDTFKLDWNDIEKALIERYGISNWIIDFARKLSITSPKEVQSFIEGYEWLKSNEKWLYEQIKTKDVKT